jgi:DNA-binding CsgD family transcriptional regulator
MVAEGIAAGLREYPGIVPVAVATSATDGERVASSADAVALDESLPGATPAASRMRKRGLRVVLLADGDHHDEDDGVVISIRARIEALAQALVPGLLPSSLPPESRLSRRETQILSLVAEGMSGRQVARHLGISEKTVERHKTRMFAKLGVSNQTAAVSVVFGGGRRKEQSWSRSST